jgi:hypothetical protein
LGDIIVKSENEIKKKDKIEEIAKRSGERRHETNSIRRLRAMFSFHQIFSTDVAAASLLVCYTSVVTCL